MVGILFAGACSGLPVVQINLNNNSFDHQPLGVLCFWWPTFGLGTLLGPEATGQLSPLWGWVCCRSILVVGCGVCFVDSGCEHLTSKACVLFVLQFLFLGFCDL